MKAGAKWLTAKLAGGMSAMSVDGCGGPDFPTGPEGASNAPAFTPRSGAPATGSAGEVRERARHGGSRGRSGTSWGWLVIALVAASSVAAPASAEPTAHSQTVCTVSFDQDEESEELFPVTECVNTDRRHGGTVYTSGVLDVQIAAGGCFYLGSRSTRWVHLGYTDGGDLRYGWSPNGRPGGHVVIGTASPCSWRRVEREEIEGYVWSRIGAYIHQSPQVEFDPPVPRGVVGIETFAALEVAAPWSYSSTSPYTGRTLRAGVKVREVRIDWNDGPAQRFRGSDLSRFTGYPDGVASHIYQTKSCDATAPRCRDELGAYRVRASFLWSGWYRVGSSSKSLTIPRTSSTWSYPVAEVIPLVVG